MALSSLHPIMNGYF